MAAYYNEHDPYAAQWLRNLIAAGHIAPGEVDERDILDVRPSDLAGFTQCHFFAGIGGWSHALRLAGWPDDRPVWTGSCPCQPFSAAGKGKGFADERHLWPAFHWLIEQSTPPVVFGEQVASPDGLVWLDLVSADLEGAGYAFRAADLCAAGIGAPHIRQRLYWAARLEHAAGDGWVERRAESVGRRAAGGCSALRMDDAIRAGLEGFAGHGSGGNEPGRIYASAIGSTAETGGADAPGPVNGHWSNADWLWCRDGRWRPVESGTFPLATGIPARVVRLRGYGNSINAEVAAAFVRAVL